MTVTYTALVATSSFSCFLKLLAMWRGSIYKLLWKDFAVFAAIYYLLSFIYRFVLDHDQQRIFELIATYCEANNSLIPVAFVLGFFINIVVSRWWNQLLKIPWPDRMAMFITASIEGLDERGRLMRRTIMRYLCLSYVITMSSISPVVRKRFPTFQHMVDSGFLLENELPVIEGINTPHNKYFVPLAWAMTLVKRARSEKRIKDDFAVKTLNDEINEYRGCLGTLFLYDWITIPLVYTQVVTLACYMFFFSCLMGRQFLKTEEADMYFPIFTFLQYFFYMGWLKVAESLINPFGEDDEDFDVNSLIDRNLQVSYLIVDEMHNEHPELIRDQYWDEVVFNLPYTVASEPFRIPALHLGSAMNINLSSRDKEPVFPMDVIDEETINSLTVPDIDSETNSENRPPRKAFRLNSITSSIKSGGRAGLNMPWKNRRVSKPISPNIPTKLSRHGRHSIRSSTSSVAGQNQAPTTPNSQNEYMFEMSDIENDPEEDGVLIDVPSPSVSPKPNPPKIVYAKTFNSKRPKFYIDRVASCDKESASEMNDVSDDQLKDRTNLLGTRGSDGDTKRGDDPMPPSYTHELPTIEESRASVSDSLGTADSGKTPPKTNEQKV